MTDQQPSMDFPTEKLPESLPVLPLFDAVLYPKTVLPLVLIQVETVQLIDEAMSKDRIVGLILSKVKEQGSSRPQDDLYTIGTAALILKMAKSEENKTQLLVQGLSRFQVKSIIEGKPYFQAHVEYLKDKGKTDTEAEALMANIIAQFNKIVKLSPGLPPEFASMAKTIQEPGTLADVVASSINALPVEKQKVLETLNVNERLKSVTRLVNHQVEILELGNKIQSQVKGDMDKKQREYYLRQQLKAIKEELGESNETNVEIEEYRTKIKEKNLPEEVRKEAERELERLERMHPSSAEYTVASTYLDWITALP
ncbi:MAG: LON peptidase substrate-binding domain-containing protein, partial [Deltaproteobacteria bacterium]|nr:LON peptidase substrate-binding domain-containing protein [Deltaproteobacteria bacterium]